MRGVAVLTITGVLSQLVGFVYRIGLTRLAGAEILGLYQLILPVYSVLLSLTSVGLTTAVSNLSAWYQALGNQRAIYQVRGQAVKLFFLLALMPCSLLLLFSDGASVYLLGDARTQLGLILLVPCLLLTGTENLQKHYFYGTAGSTPPPSRSWRSRSSGPCWCWPCCGAWRPTPPRRPWGPLCWAWPCARWSPPSPRRCSSGCTWGLRRVCPGRN